MSPTAGLVSQRAYAKHRGVSLAAVQKAIRDGRLAHALTVDHLGHKKILSCEAADNEWKAKTRPPRKPPVATPEPEGLRIIIGDPLDGNPDPEDMADLDPCFVPFQEAHRRLEVEKWLREEVRRKADEIDLAQTQGEMVPAAEARDAVVAAFTVVKTRLLGITARAAQRIPELTPDGEEILDRLVREALEELSSGG